jgi:hypothetical protein
VRRIQMKKFITILLTITIAFGLLACSSSNVDKQNNNDVTEPISTEKIEEGNNECDTPEEDKENYREPSKTLDAEEYELFLAIYRYGLSAKEYFNSQEAAK